MHVAAQNEQLDVVEFLIAQRANVEAKDDVSEIICVSLMMVGSFTMVCTIVSYLL